MFFPLDFWIRAGHRGCARSRASRINNPLPALSEVEAAEIIGPELSKPFEPNLAAQESYRTVARIGLSLDSRVWPSVDSQRVTRTLFQVATKDVLDAASGQWQYLEKSVLELSSALEVPEWQFPVDISKDMEFPELPKLKQLHFALLLRAAVLWVTGDEAGVLTQLKTAFALAERLQHCGGLFIHELVGTSCKVALLRMVHWGAKRSTNTDSFLASLDILLGKDEDPGVRLSDLMNREFRFSAVPDARLRGEPWQPRRTKEPASMPVSSAGSVRGAIAQNLLVEWMLRNHSNPFDRRETLVDLASFHDATVEELEQGWPVIAVLKELTDRYGKSVPEVCRPMILDAIFGAAPTAVISAGARLKRIDNPYGRICLFKLADIAAKLIVSSYRSQAELSATRIWIAYARLRVSGRTGPLDSLYTLVDAGFLDSIPTDPTCGLPFRLDTETQSVWLPGPKNLTFNQAYNSKQGADTWVWSLNLR